MYTSPNMGLVVWNLITDLFDYTQLENNNVALDQHDHSNGKGLQIGTAGLANGAVTDAKIATGTITSDRLTTGTRRMTTTVNKTANYTAQAGDLVRLNGGLTVTMPSASGLTDAVIGISTSTSASGTNAVTVSGPSLIRGVGLGSSATSFLLGSPGAFAVMQSDGAQWRMIAGGQDSGWQALTLTGGITPLDYTPGARLLGDTVYLRGGIVTSTTYSGGATMMTITSSAMQPSSAVKLAAASYAAASPTPPAQLSIDTNGHISPNVAIVGLVNFSLNGSSYQPVVA